MKNNQGGVEKKNENEQGDDDYRMIEKKNNVIFSFNVLASRKA